jgi:hypothetical protein
MPQHSRLTVRVRVMKLSGMALPGLLVLCAIAALQIHDTLIDAHQQKTKALVEVAHTLTPGFRDQENPGKLDSPMGMTGSN